MFLTQAQGERTEHFLPLPTVSGPSAQSDHPGGGGTCRVSEAFREKVEKTEQNGADDGAQRTAAFLVFFHLGNKSERLHCRCKSSVLNFALNALERKKKKVTIKLHATDRFDPISQLRLITVLALARGFS